MTDRKVLPCGRPIPAVSAPPSLQKLNTYRQDLKDFLSSEGLKFTEQRWNIAKIILQTGGHLDAQEMVRKVKKAHPSIGAATVYRNIKVLCDAGLLEPTHQNMEGRDVYELPDEDHHDHIICIDCGEVFEFNDAKIESLQSKVAKDFGFRLTGHRHMIHGSCDYLKRKKVELAK
jgi:Fur family transcriptional regulator, ferric uptake regulator